MFGKLQLVFGDRIHSLEPEIRFVALLGAGCPRQRRTRQRPRYGLNFGRNLRNGTIGGVARAATHSRCNSPSPRSFLRPTNFASFCKNSLRQILLERTKAPPWRHGGSRQNGCRFWAEQRVAAFGSTAARLMRAYATQVEVLRRLRNGGPQLVRVEHVHVNDGGHVVIGNVKKEDAGA